MAVQLLCHFDGASGSTVFNDTGGYHTLTAHSVTVNTTSPKFGTGCGDFTANSAAYIDTGNATDFHLGSGQFTIEAWAYFTSAPGGAYDIVSQWGTGAGNIGWFLTWNGSLLFIYSTTGSDAPSVGTTYTPTLNTWVHLACDRDASNVVRVYVNGVVQASATVSATIYAPAINCWIGNDGNLNRAFCGHLDEVRVTVGLAQYGGAFTPPTAPFPDPVTHAQVTQVALEQWGSVSSVTVRAIVTQTALEQWVQILQTGVQACVMVMA